MPSLPRRAANKLVSKSYGLFERLGYHVVPVHFTAPIPPSGELTQKLFDSRSDCVGLDWNSDVQQKYLSDVFPRYIGETTFEMNPGLSQVDSAVLHAMIRHHRPKKMIEIGSGASTKIAARACQMNQNDGDPCEFVAIEPYAGKDLTSGVPGLSRLLQQKVEDVDLSEFANCDLLFIDSSHVVRMGGDVNYEILEIVPRLKPGALVHWHDILLPGEYWKDWVRDSHYFWTEQYLLHAFLKFNREFDVIWASRQMHLSEPERITKAFPFFKSESHRITSLWIKRTGE